jgi:tetratricopeptide (TPR) repeat protein
VYEATSEFQDALAHMHQAADLNRTAIELEPDVADHRRDLSDNLAWLGTIQRGAGQLPASLESRQASRQIIEALLEPSPDDSTLQDLAAYAWRGEGYALSLVGRGAESVAAYREALRLFDDLVVRDPENLRWARDRLEALSSLLQAAIVADLGPLPEDGRLMTLLGPPGSEAPVLVPHSPQRAVNLAVARAVGAVRNREVAPDWSAPQLNTALAESSALYTDHSDDPGILVPRAEILLIAEGNGLNAEEEALSRMAATLERRASRSSDPLLLEVLARYALHLWPAHRAEPLIERLHGTGYRSARLTRECRAAGVC